MAIHFVLFELKMYGVLKQILRRTFLFQPSSILVEHIPDQSINVGILARHPCHQTKSFLINWLGGRLTEF